MGHQPRTIEDYDFREFYTCIDTGGDYAAFRFSSSSSFSFHFAMSLYGITRTGWATF